MKSFKVTLDKLERCRTFIGLSHSDEENCTEI